VGADLLFVDYAALRRNQAVLSAQTGALTDGLGVVRRGTTAARSGLGELGRVAGGAPQEFEAAWGEVFAVLELATDTLTRALGRAVTEYQAQDASAGNVAAALAGSGVR
jgi:hypothetical protein